MSYGVDGVERELAFWGDVDAVEVRHPTDYVELEIPIDLAVT